MTTPTPYVTVIPQDNDSIVANTLPHTDAAPFMPQYNAR
jgi:hypothetical protein